MATLKPRPVAGATALVLSVAAVGCSAGETVATVERTDSAGVELILSTAPAWAEGEGWSVPAAPVLEMGVLEGDPDQMFSGQVVVSRLADGRIVVGDGSDRIRFYAPDGTLEGSTGRSGEGPGEFGSISGIHRGPNDSLYVVDAGLTRVSVHDPDGTWVRLVTLAPAEGAYGARTVGVALPRLVATGPTRGFRISDMGPHRDTLRLHLYDLDGGYDRRIHLEPAAMRWGILVQGIVDWPYQPFAVDPFVAVSGGMIYLGSGRDPEIRVWSSDGALRRVIRWAADRAPVDDALKAEYRAVRAARTSSGSLDALTELFLRETDYPEELPVADRMIVDTEGNIWLRTYTFREEPRAWTVLDAAGTLLGSVDLPDGFEPRWIEDEEILGVHHDELGVARVQLLRIVKD